MAPPSKILKREELALKLRLDQQLQTTRAGGEEPSEMEISVGEEKVIPEEVHGATSTAQKIMKEAHDEASLIRKEAQEILSRVKEEMEKAKSQGFEEGRQKGLAQASSLIAQATYAKEKMFEGVEEEAVRTVYEIAEKVLGAELAQNQKAIGNLIRQALHSAIGQRIVILVNPQDLESVRAEQGAFMQILDSTRSLQIRGDEKVKPHGCLIETEIGTIDAQLETQLEAIRKALGLDT